MEKTSDLLTLISFFCHQYFCPTRGPSLMARPARSLFFSAQQVAFAVAIVPVLIALGAAPSPAAAAGPRVDVVVGETAPRLEQFAAEELSGQLKRLFDAEVRSSAEPQPQSDHTIFLGSPATNPAIANAGFAWPKL